jgi:uncharacterized protein (TIGR00255 family)
MTVPRYDTLRVVARAGSVSVWANSPRVIRSMTGFGSATAEVAGGRLSVEIRSVNHRFSEVLIRTPRDLSSLEDRARAVVQERIRRGRVDVVITRDEGARRPRTVRADSELAQAYARALRDLANVVGAGGQVTIDQIASMPDVLRVEDERPDLESWWRTLEGAVRAATEQLVAMRIAEGERLAVDLVARITELERTAEAVAARSGDVVRAHHERLQARIAELLGEVPVDPARIASEVALFADRSDISEELTRLRSHLVQFRQSVLDEDGAVGRKLDFVLQEMGRETNTIGSKANDLEITRAIIAMKSALESLREQIQNVE